MCTDVSVICSAPRGETQDYVQEAMIRILQYGPRFVIESKAGFRALISRIVENHLRDKHDWLTAEKRSPSRERELPADSVLDLDRPEQSVTRPSEYAARHEQQEWVRLAMEVIDPLDRDILLLRQWEELSFSEIGERMDLAEDAARMRFNRAVKRLGHKVKALREDGVRAIAELSC